MPRPKNPVPTYRLHKQSGQAVVTVNVNGRRRDITLGKYNSPESKEEYRRVLSNLESGQLAELAPKTATDITVNELCLRYWKHAEEYYRDADGKPTSELTDLRYAVRVFRKKCGPMPAREFGPVAFKAVRAAMVKLGWARTTVNKHGGRVKRVVRWGVENELLPADRWEALRAVRGLTAGRTTAHEPEPIEPVLECDYRATLPHVRPHVRALLEVLELTGMRPGEACRMSPSEMDTGGAVWLYRPRRHKTRYRGKKRVIPLGERAQSILSRFVPDDATLPYFSPSRDAEARMAERAAARKTPRYPSHMKRNAQKRKPDGQRKPGRGYTPHGIEVAVARACKKRKVPHWHPNQLRHLFATRIRKAHGLEAAQVLLGHARADVTEIYAEKNLELAVRIASAVG